MLDLTDVKKIYVIGIKGSGIVAIVEILQSLGIEVSGSDTEEKFYTEEILKKLGVRYVEGFSSENIPPDTDLVVYSSSYNAFNNPEIAEAENRKLKMASYPEMLAYFFNKKYGIAVCGTHGKTTTSAILANALKDYGADPSAIIGSKVLNWNGSALAGLGDLFVAEADEYQNKLRYYDPKAVILTSCDWDHPDYFENFTSYKKAFKDFVERIPKNGFLLAWGDSTDTIEITQAAQCQTMTYGFGEDCDYIISGINLKTDDSSGKNWQTFDLWQGKDNLGTFETRLVGKHNVLNAASAIGMCHMLGLNLEKIRPSIKHFKGTARRFEYVGQKNGALLIDDYGHHPDEIRATLRAARELYPGKNIWVVFHPHTYTRTKALLSEFSQSFSDADHVIILDIYGSAREHQGGVHSQDLVKLTNTYDYGKAEYIPTIGETVEYLEDKLSQDDILITLGAGNVWEVGKKLTTD